MIVATFNDEIVAFAELVFSNKFSTNLEIDCELCGLYVKNEFLKMGIGTIMFDYIQKILKKITKKLWAYGM